MGGKAKINNLSSNVIFLEFDKHFDFLKRWEMGEKEIKSVREVQSWPIRAQTANHLMV